MMPINTKSYLKDIRDYVNDNLDKYLPGANVFPDEIHKSMRYSVMAGGKRLRPTLVIAAAELVGGTREKVVPLACSLEMIHTYTLIHDDLPALDNDIMRRGMPTNHKKFGEDIAILAGDALLTKAFQIMSDITLFSDCDPLDLLKASNEIALNIGSTGTIGGQVMDLISENRKVDIPTLEYIHTHKTGKMILAAVRVGGILSKADDEGIKCLNKYAENIGLAFQVIDDILDVEGQSEVLGKETGVDEGMNKVTYPSVLGISESRRIASQLIDNAIKSLDFFGEKAEVLKDIARYIIARDF